MEMRMGWGMHGARTITGLERSSTLEIKTHGYTTNHAKIWRDHAGQILLQHLPIHGGPDTHQHKGTGSIER